jgi:thiamine thiazole synthase
MSIREVAEEVITRYILRKSIEDWIDFAEQDVVIVGAGPAGLSAAKYLAQAGLKTLIIERKLSFGGGIGGGGMLFHKVVVESPADEIIREIKCHYEEVENGIYIVDSSELIAKLASAAIDAGAKILLGVTVDDVVYRNSESGPQIVGVVLQWSAVTMSGLHVDPLAIRCKAVVDATGHDAEVLAIASRKIPELKLEIRGEKSMWVGEGERQVLCNTGMVAPGLYVAGMAVAALMQTPRMGPIFGSMLLSGRKVAEEIVSRLKTS